MLTKGQEKYLQRMPGDKIARVGPFDPRTQTTAQDVISEVKAIIPEAEAFYIGSSKLGIAGENDIDLTFVSGNNFNTYYELLRNTYGKTSEEWLKDCYAKWELTRSGFPVEMHLIGKVDVQFQEQLDTQKIFEDSPELLSEYERMKLQSNGLPWKEYLRRKYEFWNQMLENKNRR